MTKIIVPEWPLPQGVAACSSTRVGGVSEGAWDSLNLGGQTAIETGMAGAGAW
mgnify:CR=1 FL=1